MGDLGAWVKLQLFKRPWLKPLARSQTDLDRPGDGAVMLEPNSREWKMLSSMGSTPRFSGAHVGMYTELATMYAKWAKDKRICETRCLLLAIWCRDLHFKVAWQGGAGHSADGELSTSPGTSQRCLWTSSRWMCRSWTFPSWSMPVRGLLGKGLLSLLQEDGSLHGPKNNFLHFSFG